MDAPRIGWASCWRVVPELSAVPRASARYDDNFTARSILTYRTSCPPGVLVQQVSTPEGAGQDKGEVEGQVAPSLRVSVVKGKAKAAAGKTARVVSNSILVMMDVLKERSRAADLWILCFETAWYLSPY